jgi:predicted transposase/invertase (TIGR01784 family)
MVQDNSDLPPYLRDPAILRAAEKAVREGRLLDMKSDVVFNSLFSKPEARPALASLLSAIIGRPVADVSVLNPDILPEYVAGKTVRMDVHCTFNEGEEADIEMQVARGGDDQIKRVVLYVCKLGSGQLDRGDKYTQLMPFYQIMLSDFMLFPKNEQFHDVYMLKNARNEILPGSMEIHFLELPKLRKRVRLYKQGKINTNDLQNVEKWAIFLKYHDDAKKQDIIHDLCESEEGIMSAQAVLQTMSVNKEEWAREMFRAKREYDYKADMYAATVKGERRGEQRGECKVARNLRSLGISDDIIAQATGLSIAEIAAL